MKAKYLILVSLLLAIITIGAASASEDLVSDDALAAEDIAEDPIEEAPADDVIGDDGEGDYDEPYIVVYDEVNIDDYDPDYGYDSVVYVYDGRMLNGTVQVYFGDNATPVYNETFGDDETPGYSLNLDVIDLKLSNYKLGTYKVKAVYQKNGVAEAYVKENMVNLTYAFSFYGYEEDYEGGSTSSFTYGDKINFRVTLPNAATNKVTIKFNGKSYDVTLKEGQVTLTIPDEVQLGIYTATATYLGDSKYPARTQSRNITVYPLVDYDDMAVGEKSAINVYGPKGTAGTVSLYSVTYDSQTDQDKYTLVKTVPFADGQAIIPVENLPAGEHEFLVNYTIGNFQDDRTVYIDVKNNTPGYSSNINANEVIVGNTVTVTITGPVSSDKLDIYLDGKFYKSATFATGKISEVISNLAVGQHKIKVYMDTGSKFYSNTFFVTVKQTPAPAKDKIKLTLKKVKTIKKSAKKLVLKATLKINGKAKKGLKIKFKFNKKTYTAKTNKKGVAKVTIKAKVLKKLKVGKKVKIQASYGKTVKKMTAKVKK
ncbi:MAG: Ig-like domain-containing protein [Methanobrevibacter sp.]|nr:Ig-like domain-containing protein [Methanobrevibacter sp.]